MSTPSRAELNQLLDELVDACRMSAIALADVTKPTSVQDFTAALLQGVLMRAENYYPDPELTEEQLAEQEIDREVDRVRGT